MPQTLKQLCQAIAVKARLDVPTTFIGNDDSTARLILQCVKDGTLKDAFRDVDWAVLRLEHKFTTSGTDFTATNAGGYTFPQDFDRIVSGTVWDRTNDRPIIGPVSPQKWRAYVEGLDGLTGLQRICRIAPRTTYVIGISVDYRKRLQIYPDTPSTTTPNAAADPIDVVFDYISNTCIISLAGTSSFPSADWATDNDYSLIDDDVIEAAALWRLLRAVGMSYQDEREEYKALVYERSSRDAGAEDLNLVKSNAFFGENIPDTGFGS